MEIELEKQFKSLMDKCQDVVKSSKEPDIWFHGTNQESAKCIMEEGFKCYSEVPKRYKFSKGQRGERDIIWFTKEPQEACEHAIGYSIEGIDKKGHIIKAKLNTKNPLILNAPLPKDVYDLALRLWEKGDKRFYRVSYAIPSDISAEDFLGRVTVTDIQKDGKWTNPTFGELIDALGFDSIMYKGGLGGTGGLVQAREGIGDAIGVSRKDLIEVEGLIWDY